MSASNKKKLRREQEAAKMTEKQLAAQKEAKQTRLITVCFVVVMAVILTIALVVGVRTTIVNSGLRERTTTAVTVGENKISNAELNYFYMDAVNKFYNEYGTYASLLGLDVSVALDEQVLDEENGLTWADDFLASAKESVAAIYGMADAAKAAGYTLPESEATAIENELNTLDMYATMYGYSDAEQYLKAFYGNGATLKSYKEYSLRSALASSYYNHYSENLNFTAEELQAKEDENYNAYSSYSYNSYYLNVSRFLEGGTTAEDGTTTYSDEENAAALAAAQEAVAALTASTVNSVETLDAAIAALSINEGSQATSTAYTDTKYSSISSVYADWITDSNRKAGDVASFPNTTVDEDGNEVISGYYVICFNSSNENLFNLKNVRHILITPAHDHAEGETHEDGETYSEEELAAARTTAEDLLNQFKAGDATEEAFAALANEHSADGDGTTGGLYENVYPGQMVESFEDWCYADGRAAGDTGIVESTYGYHIMYFVGDSQQTYRDYQVETALHNDTMEAWYTEVTGALEVVDADIKYINTSLILSPAE